MEPQAFAFGEVGELAGEVDAAGVRRAGDRRDRERHEAGGAVLGDRVGDRRGVEPEPLVRGHDAERLGREAEHVERAGDREVRLVARVHARALERARARRVVEAEQPREVDVPRDVSAMMFAITPPDVSTAHEPSPNPISARSQPVTSSSTSAPTGPATHTSTPWFTHWPSTSPAIDIASGGGVK